MTKLVIGLMAGILMAGCAEDNLNKGTDALAAGSISGIVTYTGTTKVQRLGFAVSNDPTDPPTTMPVKMLYVPKTPNPDGIKFPVDYTIPGLQPGTYYVKVYGDVDPADGELPNYDLDPQTPFVGPVVVTTAGTATQDLEIKDDYKPGQDQDVINTDTGRDAVQNDVPVTPKPGKAAIYGQVSYSGTITGPLYVAVFDTNPPAGPPKAMVRISNPQFPQSYVIDNIPPGKVYAIAYIAVKNEPMFDPADPASNGYRELDLVPDSASRQDFELVDPK